MPYKSKEQDREAHRELMKKRREGVTTVGVTGKETTQNVTPEIEMVPALGTLPERPRYLTLSDGQVLDCAHPPKMTKRLTAQEIKAWEAANKADETITDPVRAERYKQWRGGKEVLHSTMFAIMEDRARTEKIVESIGRHNQLRNVYLGYPQLGGTPLDMVGEMLEVTS